MFMKILFGICVLAELYTVPTFLKYYWPDRCKMSFIYKMISSVLFCLCGAFAMAISGNKTAYAKYIMIGLVLGMLGDAFLHYYGKAKWPFVAGVVSFLAGHIYYIVAFQKAISKTYPEQSAFRWYEILVIFGSLAFFFVLGFAIKLITKENAMMMVPLSAYFIVLVMMLTKSARYVVGEILYGTNDHIPAIIITVLIGAILFFISDVTLGLILGNKKFLTRKMRIFNIVTYYAAQVLLASSIFVVSSPMLLN